MRTSFFLVLVGTLLSFATGTYVGRVAIDAIGVAVVLLGCIGVLGSLIASAIVDTRAPAVETLPIGD